MPGLALARRYRPAWLRHDLVAGLILTALLVPQGMAYAELAGLPPVVGLYATMVPLLAYTLLGPSRLLVLGPDSAVAPMVAAAIIPLAAAGDVFRRVELAGDARPVRRRDLLALGGIAKLGFLTDLLSKPVRVGYLAGIAVTVLVFAAPEAVRLFGRRGTPSGVSSEGSSRVSARRTGERSSSGFPVSRSSSAARSSLPRVPGVFVAVVAATVIVGQFGLSGEVPVVGPLPKGLPSFSLPTVDAGQLGRLVTAAFAIAVVAFADTSVLSRSYASRLRGGRRSESRANRARCSQRRDRSLPGLSRLQQLLEDGGRRVGRSEDAADRRDRGGRPGGLLLAFATGLFENLPAAALAAVVIFGRCRARRRRHAEAALAGPPPRGGRRARRFPRRYALRGAVGHRDRRRDLAPPLHPTCVAPARHRARPCRGGQGLPRRRAASRSRADPGPDPLPVRRAALLRGSGLLPGRGFAPRRGGRRQRVVGDRRGGAGHRRGHHRCRDARTARRGTGGRRV